ncbi:hypothetical protein BJ508DRAFT_322712 [Ascobolus immersus RN42]|uniref:Tet-like 2OG-Fe(II) oxygenase domain-containing protein n=1 Tax=Ascobolus immersus RN42 TaxID=1160509 RepID=A0A3N4IKP5_ASCIM|nr:hypothetical protein BJ508DRAFT_322712 [Ascobolus immersus RN42]
MQAATRARKQKMRKAKANTILNVLKVRDVMEKDERFQIVVRNVKRDNELERTFTAKKKSDAIMLDPTHPAINMPNFITIDGRSSCLYIIADRCTQKVVFVAKVFLFKDMTVEERQNFQEIFSYFARDKTMRNKQVLKNKAQRCGQMNAVGWRAGFQRGVHFDVYARKKSIPLGIWTAHSDHLNVIHEKIARLFYAISPSLFEKQQQELEDFGTPAAGHSFGENNLQWKFCSNMTYTCGGFSNTPHWDRDASGRTFGAFAPTDKEGNLLSAAEGHIGTTGYDFVNLPYKTKVRMAGIDGILLLVWGGPTDGHCTTTGFLPEGLDRMGFSCQISKSLVSRVDCYGRQYQEGYDRVEIREEENSVLGTDEEEDFFVHEQDAVNYLSDTSTLSMSSGPCNQCACPEFFPRINNLNICADDSCKHPRRIHAYAQAPEIEPTLFSSTKNSERHENRKYQRQDDGSDESTDCEIVSTSTVPRKSVPVGYEKGSLVPPNNLEEIRNENQKGRARLPQSDSSRAGRKLVNDEGYDAATRRQKSQSQAGSQVVPIRVAVRVYTTEQSQSSVYLPSEQEFIWNTMDPVENYQVWLMGVLNRHDAWRERNRKLKAYDDRVLDDEGYTRRIHISSMIRPTSATTDAKFVPSIISGLLPRPSTTVGKVYTMLKQHAFERIPLEERNKKGKTEKDIVLTVMVPVYNKELHEQEEYLKSTPAPGWDMNNYPNTPKKGKTVRGAQQTQQQQRGSSIFPMQMGGTAKRIKTEPGLEENSVKVRMGLGSILDSSDRVEPAGEKIQAASKGGFTPIPTANAKTAATRSHTATFPHPFRLPRSEIQYGSGTIKHEFTQAAHTPFLFTAGTEE